MPVGTDPSPCVPADPRADCDPHPVSFPQRIVLSFDFPFYGHLLRQVTIATGGESGWGWVLWWEGWTWLWCWL